MVEEIGLDEIFEKEDATEAKQTNFVDDRAMPKLSNPNPIHGK